MHMLVVFSGACVQGELQRSHEMVETNVRTAKLTLWSYCRSQEQAIISGGVRRFHGEHVSLKIPSEILLGLRSEGEEKAEANPASRGRGNPGPHPEAPQAWSNAQARLLRRSETDI